MDSLPHFLLYRFAGGRPSSERSGSDSSAAVRVGIVLVVVFLAVAFIYIIKYYGAKQAKRRRMAATRRARRRRRPQSSPNVSSPSSSSQSRPTRAPPRRPRPAPTPPQRVMHVYPHTTNNVVHVPLRTPAPHASSSRTASRAHVTSTASRAHVSSTASRRPPVPRFDPGNLPSFDVAEKDAAQPCAICLEPLHAEPVSSGQCLHIMHTSCLTGWLMKDTKSACPVCRARFDDESSLRNVSSRASFTSLAGRMGWDPASTRQLSSVSNL